MIVLMQILKILSTEQRELLKEFIDDPEPGMFAVDLACTIPDFLFNHFSIQIELTDMQSDMLARVIANGSYKSAFNTMEIM